MKEQFLKNNKIVVTLIKKLYNDVCTFFQFHYKLCLDFANQDIIIVGKCKNTEMSKLMFDFLETLGMNIIRRKNSLSFNQALNS